MRIVQWSENLRLGVPAIDAQHVAIFDVCKRLNEGFSDNPASAAEAMTFLASYLAEHFANEEALMASSGYPDQEEHRAEHAAYRTALSTLLVKAAADPAALRDVAESVTNWLLFHIMQEDRALARHLTRSRG